MSNLGIYQWMTTNSKKVGGPVPFMLLIAGSGSALYKGGEIVFKLCKNHKFSKQRKRIYSVMSPGVSNEGLQFNVGQQFKILELDGNAVLIEKIGDANNPYFVSAELLRKISNYK